MFRNLFFFLLPVLFAGCQVRMPEDIIQPDDMEELLYDYHLAQAMSADISGSDYKKKLYTDFIFKKHGVTKEYFDTSMVWYTRNPRYLYDIYDELHSRLETEVSEMNAAAGVIVTALDEPSLENDTVELWFGEKTSLLSATPLNNRMVFSSSADSIFLEGDSVVMSFSSRFVQPIGRTVSQHAHTAIVVEYSDDSFISRGKDVNADGVNRLEIPRDYSRKIKEIRGFVYYTDSDSLAEARLLLGGFSVKRIHPAVVEEDE